MVRDLDPDGGALVGGGDNREIATELYRSLVHAHQPLSAFLLDSLGIETAAIVYHFQDKPVVVYCNSGARSAQACAFMTSKGFENMHNMAGGIMAWARSGKPIALPS